MYEMCKKGGNSKMWCVHTQVARIHRFRLIEYLTLIFLLCVEKLKFYSFKHLHSARAFFFSSTTQWMKNTIDVIVEVDAAFFRALHMRRFFLHVKFPVIRFKICISGWCMCVCIFFTWICLLQHIRQLMYWIVQANSCWPTLHTFGYASFYCFSSHKNSTATKKMRLNWAIFFSAILSIWCWCVIYTLARIDRSTGKLLQIKFIVLFFVRLQLMLLCSWFVGALLCRFFFILVEHAILCMLAFKYIQYMNRDGKQKQKLSNQLRIENTHTHKKNCESNKNTTIELKFMPMRI